MTCMTCNIHSGRFITENDYKKFSNVLHALIENKMLKKIEKTNNITGPFIEEEYICTQCNQRWLLSIPDQAFRGGWYAKREQ